MGSKYNRDYYVKNKSAYIQRAREWQRRNPELAKSSHEKSRKKSRVLKPYMSAVYDAKARAKRNGIEFSIDANWARARWAGKCELTGAEFVLRPGGRPTAFSVSLDRIDPFKGYTKDNCRFILWSVNRFKSNYDDETMMRIARLLVGGH